MTRSPSPLFTSLHYIAVAGALLASVFVVNNFLTYIFGMPGLFGTFASIGLSIGDASADYSSGKLVFGWLQTLSFLVALIYPVILLRNKDISRDTRFLDGGASFIVAGAFWSVMLIGIVDASISFVHAVYSVIVGSQNFCCVHSRSCGDSMLLSDSCGKASARL